MGNNLDDEQKEHLKIEDKNKRKKAKCDNLNVDEKEQLRKYRKKGKKTMHGKFDDEQKEHLKKRGQKNKKAKCDNLNIDEKEQLRKYEKKVKKAMHE